jgi:YhcH/YjgK/YiaL family protein
MVLDSLKNAKSYYSLNPLFQKAFEYICNNDLSNVEPGKIVLEGDRLYISVMNVEGKTPENAKMEAHKNYIDIQVILKNSETMGWTAIENCKNEMDPYNPVKDIIFYTDKPTSYVTVNPGEFAIYFPEDGHAPCIGKGTIKKAVVKVLV